MLCCILEGLDCSLLVIRSLSVRMFMSPFMLPFLFIYLHEGFRDALWVNVSAGETAYLLAAVRQRESQKEPFSRKPVFSHEAPEWVAWMDG